MEHSERAKKGTASQVDGIIDFLEGQLRTYEKEAKLYADKVFADFRKAIDVNVQTTQKALDYYRKLKDEYIKDGLL